MRSRRFSGDGGAASARRWTISFHLVYAELKKLARYYLRSNSAVETLQPTAVVNELFVRLLGRPLGEIADRHHFFALSAKLLRQVLVDQARSRAALKRGGAQSFVDLTEVDSAEVTRAVDLLDLEQALEALRARDENLERVVELRYFGGLTLDETAVATGRSAASVSRDWVLARAFLRRELGASRPAGSAR